MITRFQQKINPPYSLHDMVVCGITCKNESIHLEFRHGYVRIKEPCTQVEGKITFENADMESACIFLLSPLGKYGKFEGIKMSLNDFIKQYDEYSFEIIEEMYGFHTVEYIGYFHSPKDDLIQMSLSIYFDGDIVYETEE